MAVAAVAVIGMVAMAVPAVRYLRETPPPAPPEMRTEIVTPATDRRTDFALSPDGHQIAFVASGDGASRLWLRSLATTTAQPLGGTEGAAYPFWSPDSRAIGFFAGGALKRLDLGGGGPQTLAPGVDVGGFGGAWNADGVIVFAPTVASPLMRVSATGGAAVAATVLIRLVRLPTAGRIFCPTVAGSCSTRKARRTRPGSTWARSTGAPPRG